jgi:hypothetical protein
MKGFKDCYYTVTAMKPRVIIAIEALLTAVHSERVTWTCSRRTYMERKGNFGWQRPRDTKCVKI